MARKKTIRLRGHHLICLYFFKSYVYSKKFMDNLIRIKKRLAKNNLVQVVGGADDVCSSCPWLHEGICKHKGGEEEKKKLDTKALKLLKLREGDILAWTSIRERVNMISAKWRKYACKNCDWEKECF